MKKGLALLTVLVLTMVMLIGCAAPAPQTSSSAPAESSVAPVVSSEAPASSETGAVKLKIAFISTSNVDESMKWFLKNAQEEAAAQGVELVAFDANGDVQKQTNMVADAISAKCDGIVMQCLDKKALIPALQKAKEAGLIISLMGADVDDSGKQYRDFVCAPDDLAAGKLAGETVIKKFPDGAEGIMIMGGPGEDPSMKREAGFEEAIKGSNIKLLDKQYTAGWDAAKAMATMEDYITKYGDKIKFVYAHWDNGATTIVQALEAKNMLDKVFILSVDGCRAGFDLVKSGKTAATMYQDMAFQAKECVKAVVAIKKGEKIEAIKVCPWQVITKDNATFDPGW